MKMLSFAPLQFCCVPFVTNRHQPHQAKQPPNSLVVDRNVLHEQKTCIRRTPSVGCSMWCSSILRITTMFSADSPTEA